MSLVYISPEAERQLESIYAYTLARWGRAQAVAYTDELTETFEAIAERRLVWHGIPATYEVDGYMRVCRSHVIYWRARGPESVSILAILHRRMHQIARLHETMDNRG